MPDLGVPRAGAYDALAPYYDAFTAHPNYPRWVRSVEELARRYGLAGRRVLDVGCGTGSSILPLLDLGYEVTGCDTSGGMLAQASRRLPQDVELIAADMCALPELGTFDLVWSLNDTVNYLEDVSELRRAFASVSATLDPSGVFVFDVNTLHTYRTEFASTAIRETDTLAMIWVGSGNTSPNLGQTLEARIDVFAVDADATVWRRSSSHHRQRCHAFSEIREALRAAGLSVLGLHGLTVDAVIEPFVDDARHTKAIFVATPDHHERR